MISQIRVVITVVVKAVLAKTTGLVPENGTLQRSHTVTTKAVAIAEISLQALIRHQYQRSRYTPPVPAPTSKTTCHPDRISDSKTEIPAEAITGNTVARREIRT